MNRISTYPATLLWLSLAVWALVGCANPGSGGSSYSFDLAGLPNDNTWYDIVVQSRDSDGNLLDNFALGEQKRATDTIQAKHSLSSKAVVVFVYLVGNTDYPGYFTGWDLTSASIGQSHLLRERYWLDYWFYINQATIIYGLSETQAVELPPGESQDMQFIDRPYYLFVLPNSAGHSYETTLTVLAGAVSARLADSLIDLNLDQDFEVLGSEPVVATQKYLAVTPVDYNQNTHAALVSEEEVAPSAAVGSTVTHSIAGQGYSRPSGLRFGSEKYVPRN